MLNQLLKAVNLLRKIYWRIFQPISIGVRIIVNCRDEILLIKTRYSKYWYLPGGGVRKRESLMETAKRELKEECGVEVSSNQFEFKGVYSNFSEAKNDHIILFGVTIDNRLTEPGLEIELCKFFPIDSMPPDVSPGTKRRIFEYKNQSFKNGLW